MRSWLKLLLVVSLLLPVLAGCKGEGKQKVDLAGSTSVAPFAEMLAQEYEKQHPDVQIDVQAGGSTVGIQSLADGLADIGMVSRSLNADEQAKGLTPIVIARDGIAIIVNNDNPIDRLTLVQVRGLFSGTISNWKQVGGPDAPVRIVVREESSGTREAFMHLVMDKARVPETALVQESNGVVREVVRNDPSAIGYMSLGLVGDEVTALTVDDVEPTHDNVLSGDYKLVRPFLFVVKGTPGQPARGFIDFVRSDQGQKLLESEGLFRAEGNK